MLPGHPLGTRLLPQLGRALRFFARRVDLLGRLLDVVDAGGDKGAEKKQEQKREKQRFLRWRGSLTAPPCTEGVEWLLAEAPARASPGQLRAFWDHVEGDFYGGNARHAPRRTRSGRITLLG